MGNRIPIGSGARLRVGVPPHLFELSTRTGHGKVWSRVLDRLGDHARVVALGTYGGRLRKLVGAKLDVVLASGHDDLPRFDGVPLVVQVHEAAWFDERLRAFLHPDFVEIMAPRTELALRVAAHAITPSGAARRDLISNYGLAEDRVHAVPHGADPIFRPVGRPSNARPPDAGDPYVLFAAALHPRKNLRALAEAMGILATLGYPHRLLVAGGPPGDRPPDPGPELRTCAELARGRMAWVGKPDDDSLAALMARAVVFSLPSFYEGFGLPVLEAMACGTPPVVSDRGALPEVVGNAGVVVSPTPEAVAHGLRTVLDEPELLGQRSFTAAERARDFTWDRTAAGWLRILERTVEES